jgi:AAA domain, putative AbiEii toxin, Type IV TA system/AAA domain
MYITDFELSNFKSYRNPAPIKFKPGFNIISGQNNAGKTALLEALTMRFQINPHRSVITVPVPGADPPPISSAKITIVFERDEFVVALGRQNHYFPRPLVDSSVPGFGTFDTTMEAQQKFIQWLFAQKQFKLSISLNRGFGLADHWTCEDPTLGLYASQPGSGNNQRVFMFVNFDSQGNPQTSGGGQYNESQNVCLYLAQKLTNNIYRFSAERFNIGQCGFGHNPTLMSNAQNLPEVLNVLQANTQKFLQLNRLVHEVLPQVQHVSVRALPSTQIEVIVWSHDPDSKREDLAVPLNQCGSGVGQVLAILYVVMTSHFPQTIIVDEPQSFLHPGAARKLIEILKSYPQHQYILATHSPTIIASSDPATLLMTRQSDGETSLIEIDPGNSNDLRTYLAEIGARLEDVFGADNILWVEGQTEELCFPRILRVVGKRSLMGTAILGIRQTGDLEGRDAARVFDLYRRLSLQNSLLPPALAFVLDAECRTPEQRRELTKMSRGLAEFFPRRMYENFLLDPCSIAETMNQIPGFRDKPVSEGEIRALIDTKRSDLRYFCPGTMVLPADWRREIDGARILKEMFNDLSGTRVAFVKTKHSAAITESLLGHDPEQLREIADLLVGLLSRKTVDAKLSH